MKRDGQEMGVLGGGKEGEEDEVQRQEGRTGREEEDKGEVRERKKRNDGENDIGGRGGT